MASTKFIVFEHAVFNMDYIEVMGIEEPDKLTTKHDCYIVTIGTASGAQVDVPVTPADWDRLKEAIINSHPQGFSLN
jgi:hypothetical protein